MARHGTYAGWNWHQRTGTPMCLDCKDPPVPTSMDVDPLDRKFG